MGALQLNKDLLPIKAHYLLLNGAHAGVIPFITVYGKQMGISADVMGLILAILSCATVISRPLLGSMVDKFQKLKLIVVTLILIDIAADMGLNFIPAPSTNSDKALMFCHQNSSYLIDVQTDMCERNVSTCATDCILSCHFCQHDSTICAKGNYSTFGKQTDLHETERRTEIPPNCLEDALVKCIAENTTTCSDDWFENSGDGRINSSQNPVLQLSLLSVFAAVIYICLGSLASLSDAACFNALGARPELYGKQRLWGTIGWGSFALLAGYLNQVFTGTSKRYDYSAGFYTLVVLLIIDLMVIPKLKLKDVKASKNILKDVGLLLVKPRIALFILQVYFVGIFIGMSRTYVYWYLRTLNASQLVLGCTSAVQCFLGELPFFFFAGWIIMKIGHVNTFTMSLIASGFRFLSYSFLENPWWVLPIEILQGPCFGSFYTSMASYAKTIAPEGTEATVQGLASGTFEGLGVATGSLIGGYGFRTVGGRTTFFWTGIASFVFGVVNYAISCVMSRRPSESTETDKP